MYMILVVLSATEAAARRACDLCDAIAVLYKLSLPASCPGRLQLK